MSKAFSVAISLVAYHNKIHFTARFTLVYQLAGLLILTVKNWTLEVDWYPIQWHCSWAPYSKGILHLWAILPTLRLHAWPICCRKHSTVANHIRSGMNSSISSLTSLGLHNMADASLPSGSLQLWPDLTGQPLKELFLFGSHGSGRYCSIPRNIRDWLDLVYFRMWMSWRRRWVIHLRPVSATLGLPQWHN